MVLLCADFIVLLLYNICLQETLLDFMENKNGKIIYKYFKDKYDKIFRLKKQEMIFYKKQDIMI